MLAALRMPGSEAAQMKSRLAGAARSGRQRWRSGRRRTGGEEDESVRIRVEVGEPTLPQGPDRPVRSRHSAQSELLFSRAGTDCTKGILQTKLECVHKTADTFLQRGQSLSLSSMSHSHISYRQFLPAVPLSPLTRFRSRRLYKVFRRKIKQPHLSSARPSLHVSVLMSPFLFPQEDARGGLLSLSADVGGVAYLQPHSATTIPSYLYL